MTDPIVQNASDVRQVRAAGKKVRAMDRSLIDQLNYITANPLGRKWLWNKLQECRVFLPTFDPNPYQSAYNEGFRNAGLMLLNDLNLLDPAVQTQMRLEAD
jgi:hypothetical protein